MQAARDEKYQPIYDEDEKEFCVKQGLCENNKVIFDMIEDHIDSLITRRLLDFGDAHPAIYSQDTEKLFTVNCKR